MKLDSTTIVGVIGAGTMGRGIAQVAASNGHQVIISDANEVTLSNCKKSLSETFEKLIAKKKISKEESEQILSRISYATNLESHATCGIIIEAIIEDLGIKKQLFTSLEAIVKDTCVLATNTSSLSIASLSAACKKKERVIGIHFFNPAPLMALVEIVPSLLTNQTITESVVELISSWNKKTVLAKDTPGFIVNRIARPYYGEALRIYEESIGSFQEIDAAMKQLGSFRMGPFELMDFIGNDINLSVTETVFKEFFFDPRYKPSFTQKRNVEAGLLGRKTGRGFYNYTDSNVNEVSQNISFDKERGEIIFLRILAMLINEAADALYLGIASRDDIDSAMTLGVNYPKGLLRWCDEVGLDTIVGVLDALYEDYREDRYRASVLLRRKAKEKSNFYS
jgi:3-hydroxybutyryl-CoA dehydrogenase